MECVCIESYVKEVLGILIKLEEINLSNLLPHYLVSNYKFYKTRILKNDYTIMLNIEKSENTPATIHKHRITVMAKTKVQVLYCSKRITSFERKRLIDYKIPFIIPGNQLYLPDLGIDLREYFKSKEKIKTELSPSAQMILLYIIQNKNYSSQTATQLAQKFKYSKMTLGRIFNEFVAHDLAVVEKIGKEKVLTFSVFGKQLWEKAVVFLTTPKIKTIFIRPFDSLILYPEAGLSALSAMSMLAGTKQKIYALGRDDYKRLIHDKTTKETEYREVDSIEIEIWKYPPQLLVQENKVDRLSLFLSLKETNDERVEIALEKLMDEMLW